MARRAQATDARRDPALVYDGAASGPKPLALLPLLPLLLAGCAAAPAKGAVAPPPARDPVCDAAAPTSPGPVWSGKPMTADVTGRLTAVRLRGYTGADAAPGGPLVSRPGQDLRADDVARDILRLYGTGLFDDVSAQADIDPAGGIALTYVVAERPRIGRVLLDGANDLPKADLDAATLVPGTPLDLHHAHHLLDDLHDAYVKRGYYAASVELRTRFTHGGGVDVCLRIAEGSKAAIDAWVYEGADHVKPADLAALVHTDGGKVNAPGGIYRADLWEQRDAADVLAAFYELGFFTAKLDPPKATLSADGKHLSIAVPVHEGPMFRFGTIHVTGERLTDDAGYAAIVKGKPGDVFSRTLLAKDLVRVREYHEAHGAPGVQVEPLVEVHDEQGTVDVSIQVQPGGRP
jgi:outer membrane protein insertion porin family